MLCWFLDGMNQYYFYLIDIMYIYDYVIDVFFLSPGVLLLTNYITFVGLMLTNNSSHVFAPTQQL